MPGRPLEAAALLDALLACLRDPVTQYPGLHAARFDEARFTGEARFDDARFTGGVRFSGAQFLGPAGFSRARFSGAAFEGAQFSGDAAFSGAHFTGTAEFGGARFCGNAMFGETQFSDAAEFDGAQFCGATWFRQTEFSRTAAFAEAEFSRSATFGRAVFRERALFSGAQFSGVATFRGAQFSGSAGFEAAHFSGTAEFDAADFSRDAVFDEAQFAAAAAFAGARFSGTAGFTRARCVEASWFGPLLCRRAVDLTGAVFEVPVTLEIAADEVFCVRTRWESTATVRLRHATADLSYAVLSAPVAVAAHPAPFTAGSAALDETPLPGRAGVNVASVQGVDAAHLVLTDIDLSDCLFTGALHLDRLRREGRCTFAPPPAGRAPGGARPMRWTRRRTLAEKHHWRAQAAGQPASASAAPSAGLLSGYGLRASRALAWLLAAMAVLAVRGRIKR
ncbi:pentapeptide repeat-containing protein [Streptomyces xanthophaeus]|uniref:pentapeptide repeat-containing protein n=1 Tax=Streptomyces xanthophaeus TaxID=67385 RepID=UPI00341AB5A3